MTQRAACSADRAWNAVSVERDNIAVRAILELLRLKISRHGYCGDRRAAKGPDEPEVDQASQVNFWQSWFRRAVTA